jgi:hypothetical protein
VYVVNNPTNLVDPLGIAGCADMTAQRLSGECFDSTNFQENDRVNDKGEVKTKNNKFDKEAVGSSEVDAEATSYAAATNQVKGNEQVARIDVVGDEDGTVMTSRSAVDLKSSTPSSATYDPSEIAGAEGTVHTHPIKANELAPGKGDWQPAALGVPN